MVVVLLALPSGSVLVIKGLLHLFEASERMPQESRTSRRWHLLDWMGTRDSIYRNRENGSSSCSGIAEDAGWGL